MKQRLADYVADFLVSHDITDCFSVVGGGAMYLNDALGHKAGLKVTYNHHEQACAMAAEAYARLDNRIAAVCVTTGPGATNAITGVAGAWMDSIPMLIFSGQVRYATSVYASGLKLRTKGVQEFDIIGTVKNMTKYCDIVKVPEKIRYCLEKAIYIAKEGRPGPCWLDIPLDVQNAEIQTDIMEGYNHEYDYSVSDDVVLDIIERLKIAKRPIIFVGNGVRLAGAHKILLDLIAKLKIPVVTGMSSVDAVASDCEYYVGRNGITGDRAGNFAIQNCDLLLSIGSRQSLLQTGFDFKNWAKNAYKIVNDIDINELNKDSINANLPICGDAYDLIEKLIKNVPNGLPSFDDWLNWCHFWKERYPVVSEKHYNDPNANIYVFFKEMTDLLPADINIIVGAGTSRVAGSQASVIKEGQRFITNPSMAAMGYDLPAAIGICIANNNKRVVLVTGDGGVQMNLQELQTIVENRLPIIIFIMNNHGYHSIRMTQHTYFNNSLIGIGEESGDLSFPDLRKLSRAYGLKYYRICHNREIKKIVSKILCSELSCICEVMLSDNQVTEPKVADTLENMAPFLSEGELKANMIADFDNNTPQNVYGGNWGIGGGYSKHNKLNYRKYFNRSIISVCNVASPLKMCA